MILKRTDWLKILADLIITEKLERHVNTNQYLTTPRSILPAVNQQLTKSPQKQTIVSKLFMLSTQLRRTIL